MTIEYIDPNCLVDFPYSQKLFPPLNGDAHKLLKEDIREHGIRTPLEVTKEKVILKGHERKRIALELELKEVPIIYSNSKTLVDQKIACIKDNLARKSVDFRTKLKCYEELTELYGIKKGENVPSKGQKGFQKKTSGRSPEQPLPKLSENEIAREVGFSRQTMERAEIIEKSDLPDQIKTAAFDGRLGIYPVCLILDEPAEIKEATIKEVTRRLEAGEGGFSPETIIREIKQQIEMATVMQQAGIPNVQEQIEKFYARISPPTAITQPNQHIEQIKRKDVIDSVISIVATSQIKCSVCGETHIAWKCGHGFQE